MSQGETLHFWDLVDLALDAGDCRKLHLTPGRPPMVRNAMGELSPLRENLAVLDGPAVIHLLARVVQPEQWDIAEQNGEGSLTLSSGGGRRLSLTFFRTAGNWSAVVHL